MKTFRVQSIEWKDEVEVDETIFETYESQAHEAISLSLARWIESDSDHILGVLTAAYDVERGYVGNDEAMVVMSNKDAFENIGRLDFAELIK